MRNGKKFLKKKLISKIKKMSKETDETCETMSKSNFTVEIKTKIKSLGNLFLEWSQSVTFHCFPKIFKEKTSLLMKLVGL